MTLSGYAQCIKIQYDRKQMSGRDIEIERNSGYITDEEYNEIMYREIAIARAIKALQQRREINSILRSNSFEQWGNEKCMSRLRDTIAAMKNGYASERQYRYWYCH